MDISERRAPIKLNNNENIIKNSIVTFTVPDTNHKGLGIVVETDYTADTYKVRYIANDEWQNNLPIFFSNHAKDIITSKSNETYVFTGTDITNTNFLYINDITDKNLITDLESLRELLDPEKLAKKLKGLRRFLALPSRQGIIPHPQTKADGFETHPVSAALLADAGGYSAKSIRRRRKSRRHKKTNRRHKKSNNRHKKTNRRHKKSNRRR